MNSQTQLNTSRERPPDLLSDHTITANEGSSDGSNNVYRAHAVAAGIGGSKPSSEHSSAAGSYRMAMENIIDEYSRCESIQNTVINGCRYAFYSLLYALLYCNACYWVQNCHTQSSL